MTKNLRNGFAVLTLSLSSFAAQAYRTDILGIPMCIHQNTQYQLVRGDASCPRTFTVKTNGLYFSSPELGLQVNLREDMGPERGGALGGVKYSVYERIGEIRGVDLTASTDMNFNANCTQVLVVKVIIDSR